MECKGAGSRAVGWVIHKDGSAGTSTYQKENGDDARDANCSVGAWERLSRCLCNQSIACNARKIPGSKGDLLSQLSCCPCSVATFHARGHRVHAEIADCLQRVEHSTGN